MGDGEFMLSKLGVKKAGRPSKGSLQAGGEWRTPPKRGKMTLSVRESRLRIGDSI